MKEYEKVIAERYDKQSYDGDGIKTNIYAPINPVGFYGEFKAAKILLDLVNMVKLKGTPFDKIKICDCGCGGGNKTRFMAELLGNPDQVYGTEYSKNRLQYCKTMNNLIHYEFADLTAHEGGGIPFDTKFDAITTFVVFMHIFKEEDINAALKNIQDSLVDGGLFLWYELNADRHEDGKKMGETGWGYSTSEMDKYAAKAGLKLVKKYGMYTHIPLVGASTLYLAKKVKNILILELMERLPFKKDYNIRIYRKE